MVLVELNEESQQQLLHQRLRGESLSDAVARIISASYALLLASGDPREP